MLLGTLLTGLLTWLGIEAQLEEFAFLMAIITFVLGIMLIPSLILGVAFIAMGIVLRLKEEKGALLKVFLAILLVFKVALAIVFFTSASYIWLVIFIVSIVYDGKVLFTRKEKVAENL